MPSTHPIVEALIAKGRAFAKASRQHMDSGEIGRYGNPVAHFWRTLVNGLVEVGTGIGAHNHAIRTAHLKEIVDAELSKDDIDVAFRWRVMELDEEMQHRYAGLAGSKARLAVNEFF